MEAIKKENIYLDLSKLSGEEIKEVVKILKDANESVYSFDFVNLNELRYFLGFNKNEIWSTNILHPFGKTEINLSEFRQLFSGEEVLQVDIYSGELNTERISMYKKLSEQYNIEESTVRDIFNAGADWVNKLKFK